MILKFEEVNDIIGRERESVAERESQVREKEG
jgi:hypothetical protein